MTDVARPPVEGESCATTAPIDHDTEAAFEARIAAALRVLFPMLDGPDLKHQTVFILRIGHHPHRVDGRAKTARGRLDVLISYRGAPLAVLELKAVDEALAEDDAAQAISYARLTPTIAPFAVVTNGRDSRWYTSYDGQQWTPKDVDEQTVRDVVARGAALAASAQADAIQALMGRDRDLWVSVAQAHNRRVLKTLTGRLTDIASPLAEEFSIPRNASAEILKRAGNGAAGVALVGAALSGRTNVLAQVASTPTPKLVPLYLRANGARGLFQQVASAFAEVLRVPVAPDEIVSWVRQAFRSQDCPRLLLLIDSLTNPIDRQVRQDLEELADMAELGRVRLVLATDERTLTSITHEHGRATVTPLGKVLQQRVELEGLSERELRRAGPALVAVGCVLMNGAEYSEELRQPRLLRLTCAAASAASAACPHVRAGRAVRTIPSVFTFGVFCSALENLIPSARTREDLRQLACAFIDDQEGLEGAAHLYTHSVAFVRSSTAERVLGEPVLRRLAEAGLVSEAEGPAGHAPDAATAEGRLGVELYVTNKVPELVAAAAAGVVTERLWRAWDADRSDPAVAENDKGRRAYETLISLARPLPLADLVAARVVMSVIEKEQAESSRTPVLAMDLIGRLLADRPREDTFAAGTRAYLGLRGTHPLPLIMEDEVEGCITNQFPWLVLSSVVSNCLVTAKPEGEPSEGAYSLESHYKIVKELASYGQTLKRIEPAPPKLDEMKGHWVHEIEGVGALPCPAMGIVEPLTDGLRNAFRYVPGLIVRLAEDAKAEKNLPLANRLLTASASLLDVTDASVAEIAGQVNTLAREAFDAHFGTEGSSSPGCPLPHRHG